MGRLLGACLILLGAGLLSWSVVMLWPPRQTPVLSASPARARVENAEADLGSVPARNPQTISTRVHNSSDQPISILGIGRVCALNCCCRPQNDGPVLVPPGATITYFWLLTAGDTGAFEISVPLYVDDNGLRSLTLVARGHAFLTGASDGPK